MKKKDKTEYHSMKPAELKKKAAELKAKLKLELLGMQTKDVKNKHIGRDIRRNIAVILSILRMKELL